MRYFVLSLGTLGDALPFLTLAKALQSRGLDVTVLGNGYYRDFVEQEGLKTVNLISRRSFARQLEKSELWQDADDYVIRHRHLFMPTLVRRVHRMILRHGSPKDTVLIAHDYLFGARIAQETDGFRLATVHLQPSSLGRRDDRLNALGRLPSPLWNAFQWGFHRTFDRWLGPEVNGYRASLGLPPVKGIIREWWRSEDLVLCMFPKWLGPLENDPPANLVVTGWPFFHPVKPMDYDRQAVESFLSEGSPPLVFTQSSATRDAAPFYQTAVHICQRLGRRGILLTPHAEQIPSDLPDTVAHFPFVPMDGLLPRCALHVCHGGMGSVAWTVAAGIPQLNVPWGFDQIDTSRRLKQIGVADTVAPKRFSVDRAAPKILSLLNSSAVERRCQELAADCRGARPLEVACDAVEEFAHRGEGQSERYRGPSPNFGKYGSSVGAKT